MAANRGDVVDRVFDELHEGDFLGAFAALLHRAQQALKEAIGAIEKEEFKFSEFHNLSACLVWGLV